MFVFLLLTLNFSDQQITDRNITKSLINSF